MVDLKTKYQVSLFGDTSKVIPSPEIIKVMIDLFLDQALIPSTFHEFDGISKKPKLLMSSPDSGISVHFATNRVNIILEPKDVQGSNMGEISDFKPFAVNAASKLCQEFGLVFNRLALVTEYMIKEMTEQQHAATYASIFPDSFNLGRSSKEWSLNSATKFDVNFGTDDNCLNSIAALCRQQGLMGNGVETFPFDRLRITLDLNTLEENKTTRFKGQEISAFIDSALSVHDDVLKGLGDIIDVS